jgi:hypothetical protein
MPGAYDIIQVRRHIRSTSHNVSYGSVAFPQCWRRVERILCYFSKVVSLVSNYCRCKPTVAGLITLQVQHFTAAYFTFPCIHWIFATSKILKICFVCHTVIYVLCHMNILCLPDEPFLRNFKNVELRFM